MHLPVFVLVSSTISRLRCLWRILVKLKWKIPEYIFDLSCAYIFLFYLRQSSFIITSAEWTLKIRELNDSNRRFFTTYIWIVIYADHGLHLLLLRRLSRRFFSKFCLYIFYPRF